MPFNLTIEQIKKQPAGIYSTGNTDRIVFNRSMELNIEETNPHPDGTEVEATPYNPYSWPTGAINCHVSVR